MHAIGKSRLPIFLSLLIQDVQQRPSVSDRPRPA
jgi:hypothetical protein